MFKQIGSALKAIPAPVQVGGGIALVYFGYRWYKKGAEARENKKRLQIYQQSLQPVTYSLPDGSQQTITVDLSSSASVIYDSIYNNDPLGITEDETRVVNELKKIPRAFIKRLSDTYLDLYKKDLKADVIKALDEDEWDKVSHLFG